MAKKKGKQHRSFTGNKGPGRPLKFEPGSIVTHQDHGLMVVVDYQKDPEQRGMYRAVRLLSLYPFRRVGPAIWDISWKFEPYNWKDGFKSYVSVLVYRANQRLGETAAERGCSCMCCCHVAYPRNQISADGSWKDWEGDDED